MDSINFVFNESDASTDIELPEEVITKILVRLPVKSLLKFKCVSKSWLSLISDPQFIRSNLSQSCSMDELNVQLLFATKTGMKKCCLYSALHEPYPSRHVSGIEFLAQNEGYIIGIINGLVCLNLRGTDLCVWNPALNKIKHFNFHPQPSSDTVRICFSFGYDEPNDDYKVVCLQSLKDNDGVFYAEVLIYSLNADSWRRIEQLKGFYLPYPGVFAYGNIYWSADLFAPAKFKIFSLDMSSEKFVALQSPQYDAGNCIYRMGVSGGRPFVLCDYYQGMKVDLWVLDKHGVEESWSKLVSFPYTVLGHNVLSYNYWVLCISSNGEIVLGDDEGLIVYNWKKKESRKIKLAVGRPLAAYVESLVWPNYA